MTQSRQAHRLGEIERLRHRPGELLRSRDFRDQAALDAQLRWWHNTAIHNAFGISSSLQAEVNGNQIIVHPGLAYDIFGRELWLQEPTLLSLPESPQDGNTLVLIARYREDPPGCRGDDLADSCLPGSAPRRIEQADLVLVDASSVSPQAGVTLAILTFTAAQWTIAPSSSYARPLSGPYVRAGRTIPGQTIWTERPLGVLRGILRVFFTEIDTSAAGFTRPPCYFAWINGPRLLSVPLGNRQISGLVWPLYLEHSLPQRFQFSVGFLPLALAPRLESSVVLASLRNQNYVTWLGMEPLPMAKPEQRGER